jgi:hypothetical protein
VFAATSVSRIGHVTITETVPQEPVRSIARPVRFRLRVVGQFEI